VIAFVIGARWGITGVTAAYLVANMLNAIPALYFSGRLIDVTLGALLRCIAPAVGAAVLMAAIVMALQDTINAAVPNALLAFLILVACGAVVYALASLVLLRPQLLSLRSFLGFEKKAKK
jgi:PST family polysaccharide transporter